MSSKLKGVQAIPAAILAVLFIVLLVPRCGRISHSQSYYNISFSMGAGSGFGDLFPGLSRDGGSGVSGVPKGVTGVPKGVTDVPRSGSGVAGMGAGSETGTVAGSESGMGAGSVPDMGDLTALLSGLSTNGLNVNGIPKSRRLLSSGLSATKFVTRFDYANLRLYTNDDLQLSQSYFEKQIWKNASKNLRFAEVLLTVFSVVSLLLIAAAAGAFAFCVHKEISQVVPIILVAVVVLLKLVTVISVPVILRKEHGSSELDGFKSSVGPLFALDIVAIVAGIAACAVTKVLMDRSKQ